MQATTSSRRGDDGPLCVLVAQPRSFELCRWIGIWLWVQQHKILISIIKAHWGSRACTSDFCVVVFTGPDPDRRGGGWRRSDLALSPASLPRLASYRAPKMRS